MRELHHRCVGLFLDENTAVEQCEPLFIPFDHQKQRQEKKGPAIIAVFPLLI